MFYKKFEVRWNDLDANRHLANSSYINFMSHTRMSFLETNNFGHKEMLKHNIGPVVFYEHVYYFKEVFPGKPVKVTLELGGLSENGMFFEFVHNFYDEEGNHLCHCEMLGAWIDLESRQLITLSQEHLKVLEKLSRTESYRTLTKEDTRKHGKRPKNLI